MVQLKQDNHNWQDEHDHWTKEIAFWQHQTQRLVALLYKLERSLPEHSSKLERHKDRIESYNEKLVRYECGLDEHCMPTCPSHIPFDEQRRFHDELERLHAEVRDEHEQLRTTYLEEMKQFHTLVATLLKEARFLM